MAKIYAGIGTSHVPAIGAAMDLGKTHEEYWQPLFEGYEPARQWVRDNTPDVAIVVFNDHASALSLDMIPTFAIGVADEFLPADEGFGRRPVPTVKGHPKLAWHLAESLIINDFDMTIINRMDVDHGLTVPLSITCGEVEEWPFPVIPLAVNVVNFPPPSGDRCFRLGQQIRKAVESFPDDLKVAIYGTGGMSHQIHGERAGVVNQEFDQKLLDDLTADPERLRHIPHLEYVRECGAEGIEMVMWQVMRGALSNNIHEVYRHYHVPASNTGAGLIILEEDSP